MTKKLATVLAVALFCTMCGIWYVVAWESRDGLLTVAMLDVGQGDAIFIDTPHGNQILIDGGPYNNVLRELGKVMPFYDRAIDMLVITNPDKDHMEGFMGVLKRFKVGHVLEPGTANESELFRILMAEINKQEIPRIVALRGQSIELDRGVYLDILFPDRDVSKVERNTGSIVARLRYGATSFLFTGDTTKTIENYLVKLDGEKIKSDVLKAGHHGSKTSTGNEFVKKVAPALALISAGKDNKYGHPHKEVIDVFAQNNVEVFGTYDHGRIILKSDGKKIYIK